MTNLFFALVAAILCSILGLTAGLVLYLCELQNTQLALCRVLFICCFPIELCFLYVAYVEWLYDRSVRVRIK